MTPDIVFRSPARDALLQYGYMMKNEALAQFKHDQTLYVQHGLKSPPKLPDWVTNG